MQASSPIRNALITVLCGLFCVPAQPASATTAQKKPSQTVSHSSSKSSSSAKKKRSRTKGKSAKARGQKAIESERAQQIQQALIREHYMEGEPSGKWDEGTQAALRRYQADQGWQSKSVPDSRALIKLGLGPNHDHLLNPESAMTTAPIQPKAAKTHTADTAPAANTPLQSGVPQ